MKFLICALLVAGVFISQCYGRAIVCQCDCKSQPGTVVCAKDPRTGDTDTFLNICQMQCYNCTHTKNYFVIKQGDCRKKGKS